MRSAQEPMEDLIARARRGDLSSAEARRLDLTLTSSAEARLLYDVGQLFDRESAILPGDEELNLRLADRIESRYLRKDRRVRFRTAAFVVGALLLSSAAAAAGWQIASVLRHQSRAEQQVASPSSAATGVRVSLMANSTAAATARSSRELERSDPAAIMAREGREFDAPELPTGFPGSKPRPAPTLPLGQIATRLGRARDGEQLGHEASRPQSSDRVSASEANASTALDAPQLYAQANQARRDGQSARASELYRALEQRFPASVEARESHLTLARIYLGNGSPALALAELDRYRVERGLIMEALWMRAEALRQLGRAAEERAVLDQLVEQAPTSPYGRVAAERLRRANVP